MSKILIINGHQYYPFAEGNLNNALLQKAKDMLERAGIETRTTITQNAYEVDEEVEKWLWADAVFLQMPLNWMGVSWSFKKYMDEVFTAGMMGKMSAGDGRSAQEPKRNYGMGGLLKGKYMMSVTANAPKEAFGDKEEQFFEGLTEDELLRPMHLNFKWFGLSPLPTFFCYDVMKNPEVTADFERFETHIKTELIERIAS